MSDMKSSTDQIEAKLKKKEIKNKNPNKMVSFHHTSFIFIKSNEKSIS